MLYMNSWFSSETALHASDPKALRMELWSGPLPKPYTGHCLAYMGHTDQISSARALKTELTLEPQLSEGG